MASCQAHTIRQQYQQLTKALVERALQGELTHHLGYDKHSPKGNNTGNSRNGSSAKTLRGKRGQLQIDVPRDRSSEFEPQLVKKDQTRFDGPDDKIISLYARGMTTREIQGHLEEIYGVEVSPGLISSVTDAVIDEVRAWQTRPLDSIYPIVYLDAIQVKVKSQGRERPVYLQIVEGGRGKLECRQIEFLTPEQLADLAHVETRTVYSWIEKAEENGLKFYRAQGTRGVIFEINEVLEWIRNAV